MCSILGSTIQDPIVNATLQASVAGYQYPITTPTPTMTTAAFNVLNNGEKLSKKQRKKLAAAMNEAAMSKSSFNEGKPSHEKDDVEDDPTIAQGKTSSKANNILPIWGNEKTMNLNPLLLTNIQNSPYFKVSLYVLKTYHEVIDEIWNQVKHLEPWERGSRKVSNLSRLHKLILVHLVSRSEVKLECAVVFEGWEQVVLSQHLFAFFINYIPFV